MSSRNRNFTVAVETTVQRKTRHQPAPESGEGGFEGGRLAKLMILRVKMTMVATKAPRNEPLQMVGKTVPIFVRFYPQLGNFSHVRKKLWNR